MAETGLESSQNLGSRILRFLQKPSYEWSRSFYSRWRRIFPTLSVPVRLPFGAWWIARNDYIGSTIAYDGFDVSERLLIQKLLRPGMTVLDIGAHNGFYTLLFSKLVGGHGAVIAFEPSPREHRALRLNLRINRAKNVTVHALALGEEQGPAILHLGDNLMTGCNSLRKSTSVHGDSLIHVEVTTLDQSVSEYNIGQVDFIKVDVEGAELGVLKGAKRLLERQPRPVILAEVEDRRTEPWGYRASEIVRTLREINYDWFSIESDGCLRPIGPDQAEFNANLLAVPSERRIEILARLPQRC
jgi:FkbM family methyltransferase